VHDTINPSAEQQLVGSVDLLDPVDRVRIFSGAAHLYDLGGPRPLGEALIELAETCGTAAVLDVLARYSRLTPETVSAAGAAEFPRLLQAAPS
jgi:uncharacterized UPF0146 family protein